MRNEQYIWILLDLIIIVRCENFSESLNNCPKLCHCQKLNSSTQLDVTCKGIDLKYVPKLNNYVKFLDISYNPLMKLSNGEFKTCKNLSFLIILKCNISEIESTAFEGLFNVSFINLAFNSIKYINPMTFYALTSLETLILTKNPLKMISGPFLYSNHIRMPDISKCDISSVSHDAFRFLPILEVINLRGNMLNTLQNNTFEDLNKLKYVNLNNNFWFCTCEMKDFFMRLSSKANLSRSKTRNSTSGACVGDVYSYEGTIFCGNNSHKVPLWSDCHNVQCEEKSEMTSDESYKYITQSTTISSSAEGVQETSLESVYVSVTVGSSEEYFSTDKSVSSNVSTSILTSTENLNSVETKTYAASSYSQIYFTIPYVTTTKYVLELDLKNLNNSKSNQDNRATNNILLISLIIVLTFSMFVLGIFVGIKYISSKHVYALQGSDSEHACCFLSICRNTRLFLRRLGLIEDGPNSVEHESDTVQLKSFKFLNDQ